MLTWIDPFFYDSLIRSPEEQFTPEQKIEALVELNLEERTQDHDQRTSQGRPLNTGRSSSPGDTGEDQ